MTMLVEYTSFHEALGILFRGKVKDLAITYDGCEGGNCFFAFDLTPDQTLMGHGQPHRNRQLKLEVRFREVLSDSTNVILYAVLHGKIEITKARGMLVQ